MKAYLDALVERMDDPGSRKAHEILRSTMRTEHQRSLNLSSVIRNQHILRDILFGVVERSMPEGERQSARTAIEAMIDRSVEEIVLLLEDFTETQGVLMRCLSCSPAEKGELEHILARFCRNAMDYFDADIVVIFRHAEGSRELTVVASAGKGVALPKDRKVMFDSFPLAAEAVALRRPRTCVESAAAGGPRKRTMGSITFEHCLAVPMETEGRITGLFFVADSTRSIHYTSEEVSMAEDLAGHVRRVLMNADIFEVLSVRSRAQKALIDTAVNLQKEIESEEIYRIVGDKVVQMIPCSELAFYMFDWERRVGNPVYSFGPYAAEVMGDKDFPADVGICGHVARTKRAEIIHDTESDPRGDYIPGTPATHSRMLAVPLVGRKDVLGVIELLKYPPDDFAQEDLEIATLFANHAAVAIENARLLKEVLGARDQVELSMDLMTHDIANYTTPVTAYLDSLIRHPGCDDTERDKLTKALFQVESIMGLVDMVRLTGRLKEDGARVTKRTDLGAAISSSVDRVRKDPHAKPFDAELKLPAGTIAVMADELLGEAFRQLVFTAVKSDRQERPRLIITAEQRRDGRRESWHVMFSQPNRSIPDHLKAEVLKMGRAGKSELTGGFGLGLALARAIVERQMGRMWVSDIVAGDPSRGCVFNITLPKA
ncbi:MAG: GAF domain-containing protein [Thermoplasmata archaeon]|nr:GAF domain-containing protein [Thermoplasmata archaeon]